MYPDFKSWPMQCQPQNSGWYSNCCPRGTSLTCWLDVNLPITVTPWVSCSSWYHGNPCEWRRSLSTHKKHLQEIIRSMRKLVPVSPKGFPPRLGWLWGIGTTIRGTFTCNLVFQSGSRLAFIHVWQQVVLSPKGFPIRAYWYPHWENRVSIRIKVSPDRDSIVDIEPCQHS